MSGAGRTALVTGGSAGIGLAIVDRLLEDGFTVLSLARRTGARSHARLIDVEVDLLDAAATAQCAREIADQHAVTHLVHNAGVIWPKLLEEVELSDLQGLTQLHLGAAISLVQASLPAMRRAGRGRIVLMSSRAATGLQTRTAYSATKSGMIGMARTWALELAPAGITVNVVAPGPIQTDMFHDVIPKGSPKVAEVAARIPVQRLGTPEDVAHATMFFLADEAGFVTGQTLFVCGGASIGSLTL